jgi:hypothetical protein
VPLAGPREVCAVDVGAQKVASNSRNNTFCVMVK